MKKEVLILFMIIFFPFISAQNITVDYNSEVFVGQVFSFKLNLSNFEEDVYDVKIDITANDARIANILNNDQWKSTFYYILDAISPDQEKEFSLNITEYIGNANILIRIRDSSGSSVSFEGYEITCISQDIEQETITQPNQTNLTYNNQTEEPSEEKDNEENSTIINQTKIIAPTSAKPVENQTPSAPTGILRLNPKVIKSDDVTRNLEKSDYAVHGFIIFCILLAFLFALKNIKTSKNEFAS